MVAVGAQLCVVRLCDALPQLEEAQEHQKSSRKKIKRKVKNKEKMRLKRVEKQIKTMSLERTRSLISQVNRESL